MAAASPNGGRPPIGPGSNLNFTPNATDLLILKAQTLMQDLETGVQGDLRRCKMFYRVHFPELEQIVRGNLLYARVVQRIGRRTNLPNVDLSDLLTPQEIERVVEAARTSRGIDMSDDDIEEIFYLCDHVIAQGNNHASLEEVLEERMATVAPNLTAYLGSKLGAKLIVQVGSLVNLTRKTLSARRRRLAEAKEEAAARAAKQGGESGQGEATEEAASTATSAETGEETFEDPGVASKRAGEKPDEGDDDAPVSKKAAVESDNEEIKQAERAEGEEKVRAGDDQN